MTFINIIKMSDTETCQLFDGQTKYSLGAPIIQVP